MKYNNLSVMIIATIILVTSLLLLSLLEQVSALTEKSKKRLDECQTWQTGDILEKGYNIKKLDVDCIDYNDSEYTTIEEYIKSKHPELLGNSAEKKTTDTTTEDKNGNDCDSSYPNTCIPSPPPNLNCGDISEKRFKVEPPDPHGFDRDGDGIGCNS